MVCNYFKYHIKMTNSWIPPVVNSKDGVNFALLSTLRESRRTSDSALLRVRSKELRLFTLRRLDSEALLLLQLWGKPLIRNTKKPSMLRQRRFWRLKTSERSMRRYLIIGFHTNAHQRNGAPAKHFRSCPDPAG